MRSSTVRAARQALSFFAVCAMFSATMAPIGTTTALAASSCLKYEFIGARGSGQLSVATQLGMGKEVFDLFTNLQNSIGSASISGYGVNYPAVDVFDTASASTLLKSVVNGAGALLHIGFLGGYTDSVQAGTKDTINEIERKHASCPGTRFILSGYSQGAQAVGDALQRMSATDQSLVVAAGFFGDPYFNARSASARGTFDPSFYGLFGPRSEWPKPLSGKVFSYCHVGDPICNISNDYHILGDGEVYVRNPFHIDASAHVTPAYISQGDTQNAALAIEETLGIPLPITLFSGPLDIAFAIDSTGSMGNVIAGVQQDVSALVDDISAIDSNFRVGLVDYKDAPNQDSAYQSRVDTPLTVNLDTFKTALDGLSAVGGGDTPESVYSGVMAALGLTWRNGARKIVIQIGDAAAKDPEPVTGFTLADVRAKALSVDPAVVDSVQAGSDSNAQASFQAMDAATGGTYLDLPNEADVSGLVPAIQQEVTSATNAPIARLVVPIAGGLVGNPVAFSAAGSTDSSEPIVGYDWDFNNDGVFDLTTATPVVQNIYSAGYSGNVVVRVRSKSGLTGLASVAVSVLPPLAGPPGIPTNLRGFPGTMQATLTWSASSVNMARWFNIYDGTGNLLDRVAANADGSAPPGWVDSGLTPGNPYIFEISAGSERGESGRTGPVTVIPTSACSISYSGKVSSLVTVKAGQTVCLNDAAVTGSVMVNKGGMLTVTDSTIQGGLLSGGAVTLSICGSHIAGLQLKNSSGLTYIGNSAIGCNADELVGSVVVDGNTGAVTFDKDTIDGSITILQNSGGVILQNNLVDGSISCSGNTPAPVNSGQTNMVSGAKSGQCAQL